MSGGAISRRDFIRHAGALPAVAALAQIARAQGRPRPNILFMMSDDHASHAISCYGSVINQTPHIDRIAQEGLRFDNCFCTNSICAPSRAVILTGKFSHLNGVIDNAVEFDGTQNTFPKVLQSVGYRTALIGKWHLKSDPTGFDYWSILPGQGVYQDPEFIEMGQRSRRQGYVTDLTADYAIDWLRAGRDPSVPFLLMCHHKAPHREWLPPDKYRTLWEDTEIPVPATLHDDWESKSRAAFEQEMTILNHLTLDSDLKGRVPPEGLSERELREWRYQHYIKDYLRCIRSVDDNTGRILEYLDESGLAEDTLVIYTSDQGFYLGDHGWFDKRFMYEESLRMPLVMRWPGVIEPASTNDELIQNVDFAPTLLDAASAPVPDEMQGDSFLPMLVGGPRQGWRDSIYYHYYEYPAVHMVKRHYGVRTKRYKLMHFYHDIDAWELYDLALDPEELQNRIDVPAYAGVVARLKEEIRRLQALYGDDIEAELARLRHPDFERLIGAGVRDEGLGYLIASGGSGYALQKLPQTCFERVSVSCRMRTRLAEGTRNGMLCFGPATDPASLVKAGVYIGAGELVIQHGGFGEEEALIRLPVDFEKEQVFKVSFEANLRTKRLRLVVDGVELLSALRKDWSAVSYVGYTVTGTETEFSTLGVRGG